MFYVGNDLYYQKNIITYQHKKKNKKTTQIQQKKKWKKTQTPEKNRKSCVV